MKRLLVLFLALVVGVAGLYFLRGSKSSTKVLKVVTWSGYFPDGILVEFTQKTGIRVELSFISSNEELFAKLKAGASGFDVIQPSDYMIEQMVQLKMLEPLRKDWLPHIAHLDPYYLKLPYDPELRYSIPFVRGTTGVAVNTERVKIPEGGITWDFLLNSPDPRHTSLLDDMREVNSAVLFQRNKSPNSIDPVTLEAAAKDIQAAKNHIALFSSEPLPLLLRGDVTIAHAYSTHGIQAGLVNPKIKYFLPKEGNTVWTDNFAVPAGAPKSREAHLFIDYFLQPENALAIVEQNHLATPNLTARRKLPVYLQKDETLYPSEAALQKMQFLRGIGDGLLLMNRLWTDIKS